MVVINTYVRTLASIMGSQSLLGNFVVETFG